MQRLLGLLRPRSKLKLDPTLAEMDFCYISYWSLGKGSQVFPTTPDEAQ